MTYDYFYGQQAEMFAFYRVPKVLFTEDCFWNVSTDAKLLYGILLDRMNLSARNGWLDEEGRVYIIFTIEEIKGALGCAEKKAVKLLDELEKKCGLIERKRQGLGKPNLIYVKNFISGSVERQFLNCQKDNSGVVKNTIQELSYSERHNRKVVFAYLLLPGINDRSSDVRQLAKWFRGKNVMINVLQYNPTSNSKIRTPQKREMVAFKHQLEQVGLEVTMRVSHGREIKAACGQLANTYNKFKKK